MMLNENEKKALRLFAQRHVMRKSEFQYYFQGNGSVILSSLLEKGLITKIVPIGETAYAITQKGIKLVEEIVSEG